MDAWKELLIDLSSPIIKAIEEIDAGKAKILIVVDKEKKLKGTITDGDIRRGILKGVSFDDKIERIINPSPRTASAGDKLEDIMALMKEKQLSHIPVIDDSGYVVGVRAYDEIRDVPTSDHWVVLMAGGMGNRLRPLTEECPKPLLTVGTKPILETILENFKEYGFKKFFLSVNYKVNMIKDYFGDGSRWGIEIGYLCEDKRLGTAGALGLLPEKPEGSVIVMNGDLITKVNFRHLLDFHKEHGSKATMCVREYDFQVPFGVVKMNDHNISKIDEKPVHKFFINAGIYVLEPEVVSGISGEKCLDMPHLFNALVEEGKEPVAFPIREYWVDIGRIDDLERADGEFSAVFK
ncbi:MAG: nucleotidyltransferase family protein [Candidatus Omnitrophica bacterium]|nr:nucleotidyltransferase family protein [Candidatus Omnitrophota bacterium]MBU1128591.1 nucleotidyltransferase family protein [Candidatus Omnitrophota bacterium]MBU1784718.1 nucleotidyltransferase family protein [Candidatus Omnitrophota bacterium]MBU1851559.1 nucleotidyltransferase family protein [Candidatus Omnitrophota bacterium]